MKSNILRNGWAIIALVGMMLGSPRAISQEGDIEGVHDPLHHQGRAVQLRLLDSWRNHGSEVG